MTNMNIFKDNLLDKLVLVVVVFLSCISNPSLCDPGIQTGSRRQKPGVPSTSFLHSSGISYPDSKNLPSKFQVGRTGDASSTKFDQNVLQKLSSIEAILSKMQKTLTQVASDEKQSSKNIDIILRHFFHQSCDEAHTEDPIKLTANGEVNVETILPNKFVPIKVKCEGEWTVILNRQSGMENFARNYFEYENGFGDPKHEYYIGNKALYHLTNWKPHQLRVELEDFSGKTASALYKAFKVGSQDTFYKLTVGKFDSKASTAGDGLSIHNDMIFTTVDKDGDSKKVGNCATLMGGGGGWWYNDCYHVLGTGLYRKSQGNDYGGIAWWPWHHVKHSLKTFKLLIKPI